MARPDHHALPGARVPARRSPSCLAGLLALLLSAQLAPAAEPDYVPGEVLVKFRDSATALGVQQSLAARPDQRPLSGGLHRVGVRPGETVEQVILELESQPEVEFAEPNYLRHVQQISVNDTLFSNQWALRNTGQQGGQPGADISALEAWAITTGSREVIVAVIDSGIDRDHPDLSANLWNGPGGRIGWDFIGIDDDPNDTAGHGTYMAGIIGARGNNNTGIAGTAWSVSLMPLRVFNANGSGTVSDITAAIDFAVANGARVINASFGANRFSQSERSAIQRAAQAGVLVVASACNQGADNDTGSGQNTPCYPASYDLPNILSVAATGRDDGLLGMSNYGASSVDLGAPGDDILTTAPRSGQTASNPYVFVSGTSASSAFVSGAAALLLAHNPALDAGLLREALLDSVDPAPNLVGRTVTGGRLNVAAALDSLPAQAQSGGTGGNRQGAMPGGGGSGRLGAAECLLLLLFAACRAGWRRARA